MWVNARGFRKHFVRLNDVGCHHLQNGASGKIVSIAKFDLPPSNTRHGQLYGLLDAWMLARRFGRKPFPVPSRRMPVGVAVVARHLKIMHAARAAVSLTDYMLNRFPALARIAALHATPAAFIAVAGE